jgi:cysteinyl-tRNA synthetase
MKLTLTNTLTREKDAIVGSDKPIALYVCGITPYDYAHIGHGRVYVTFDLLYRLLTYLGNDVRYCRNITDIDDKLINRAIAEQKDPHQYKTIASFFTKTFEEDVAALSCLQPHVEPRVTDHIPQIIEIISTLMTKGIAYQAPDGVYFSLEKWPSYGKLSQRLLDDLLPGARVEAHEGKKSPGDFALWKRVDNADVGFNSPWGYGRPGWHIECSAMARTYLGDTLDIHGGGMDLIFPHHENEIAQSEAATGKKFARVWVHNAFVRIDTEKMSKSLGNFVTLRDFFARHAPHVARFIYLNHHYRSPLDFSWDDCVALERAYERMVRILSDTVPDKEAIKHSSIARRMIEFLCDDLNTPGALGVLFSYSAELATSADERAAVGAVLTIIMGIELKKIEKTVLITPIIEQLIAERDAARAARDWSRADALREKLRSHGYVVQDKK